MKIDYRDSEKFRADQHKFWGNSLTIPIGLDILNILVFGKNLDYKLIFVEFFLFYVGYLFITKSYEIMEKRDKLYVGKYR
jgi:hypothetical protein